MNKIDPKRVFDAQEAQEKRSELLSIVLDGIKQVKEIESGYSLRFDPYLEDLILITDWIQIERSCNPFLRFRLTIESNSGPVWLDMSGPAGTQNFLKTEYGLNRWL